MPLPQDSLARQQAAIFDVLGEPATWTGAAGPVRVKRREADEIIRSDFSDLVGTGRAIMVRKSEVPAPVEGDQVQILDDAGNALADAKFAVNGEPKLDRRGNWHCPVEPVA